MEDSTCFVVTLPLVVDLHQRKKLEDTFYLCKKLYNAAVANYKDRYRLLLADPQFKLLMDVEKGVKRDYKAIKQLVRQHGFLSDKPQGTTSTDSVYGHMIQCATQAGWRDSMTPRVPGAMLRKVYDQVTVAASKFINFIITKKYGYTPFKGDPGFPRFMRRRDSLRSVSGRENAGIALDKKTMTVKVGNLLKPRVVLKVDTKKLDPYMVESLENEVRYCRVLKDVVKGRVHYRLQVTLAGLSPVQKFIDTVPGALVGLDMGPRTVAWVSDEDHGFVLIPAGIDQKTRKLRVVQRKISKSFLINNKHCLTTGGAWIKGSKTVPMSKRCLKLKKIHAETWRRLAEQRKNITNILAKQIVAKGNVVKSEDITYKSWQMGRYGKSMLMGAPGEFIAAVRQRAKEAGGVLIDLDTRKLKMSQFDHTIGDYLKKDGLKVREHVLRDGSGTVHRDVYSAFLAKNVVLVNHRLERKKGTKTVERIAFDDCYHDVDLLKKEFARYKDLLI